MKILDMSAGARAMWFNKAHPSTTYLDIRPEICPKGCVTITRPDIVCDTRDMPLPSGRYNLIVFDPPHYAADGMGPMARRYGSFSWDWILDTIAGSAKEAHRVGAPDAVLTLKWAGSRKGLEAVLDLMQEWWEPLYGHGIAKATRIKDAATFWVVMRRRDAVR